MCIFLVKICTIRVKGVWFLARSSFSDFLVLDHSGGSEDLANQV